MTAASFALPGQILGSASDFHAGPGTHLYNSSVCASIAGRITSGQQPISNEADDADASITTARKSSSAKKPGARGALKPTLSISRYGQAVETTTDHTHFHPQAQMQTLQKAPKQLSSTSFSSTNTLPEVNARVLAKVTRTTPHQATVQILTVNDEVCSAPFSGIIRVEDVRATEKDRVKISASFRPGDVVRAVVISLGDQTNYYLSTASNELGVVMARSDAGNDMFPVSWREMRDSVTGGAEERKVARPF